MSTLKIPESDIIALDFYLSLNSDVQEKVNDTFKNFKAGTSIKDLELNLIDSAKLSAKRAEDIVTLALNMLNSKVYHENDDDENFEQLLANSFAESDQSKHTPEEYTSAAVKLISIAPNELIVTINGYIALLNEAKIFRKAKTSISVKPIFIKDKNYGGVIVHHLKINFDENDSSNEIILSLDDNDLKKLKEEINKAEKKAKDLLTQKDLKIIPLSEV